MPFEQSGHNPDEFALHSLRIGGATTLAAGVDISERLVQRKGRWRFDAYKAYTRNNIDDSRRVSCKLVVASEWRERQPGEETVWGKKWSLVYDNSSLTYPRSWRSRMVRYHSEAW